MIGKETITRRFFIAGATSFGAFGGLRFAAHAAFCPGGKPGFELTIPPAEGRDGARAICYEVMASATGKSA